MLDAKRDEILKAIRNMEKNLDDLRRDLFSDYGPFPALMFEQLRSLDLDLYTLRYQLIRLLSAGIFDAGTKRQLELEAEQLEAAEREEN